MAFENWTRIRVHSGKAVKKMNSSMASDGLLQCNSVVFVLANCHRWTADTTCNDLSRLSQYVCSMELNFAICVDGGMMTFLQSLCLPLYIMCLKAVSRLLIFKKL